MKKCTLCNYADDNTLYTSSKNIDEVIQNLKKDFITPYQTGFLKIV